MKKNIIEVCAASVQSARNAQKAGAHRVELCGGLEIGGITPSAATILKTRALLDIDVFVLIRPRGGDFCYSPLEIETIKDDILFCKNNNIDGVVIGMLEEDGTVNSSQLKELVDLAAPMQVTFHRAFDRTADPFLALEKIIDAGVHRILTSGQKATAFEGRFLLRELVKKANNRITILAGAGINRENILNIAKASKTNEFHLSGKSVIKSPMNIEGSTVQFSQNGMSENDYYETNTKKIIKVVQLMKK